MTKQDEGILCLKVVKAFDETINVWLNEILSELDTNSFAQKETNHSWRLHNLLVTQNEEPIKVYFSVSQHFDCLEAYNNVPICFSIGEGLPLEAEKIFYSIPEMTEWLCNESDFKFWIRNYFEELKNSYSVYYKSEVKGA